LVEDGGEVDEVDECGAVLSFGDEKVGPAREEQVANFFLLGGMFRGFFCRGGEAEGADFAAGGGIFDDL
jgi:hypothetical protein